MASKSKSLLAVNQKIWRARLVYNFETSVSMAAKTGGDDLQTPLSESDSSFSDNDEPFKNGALFV